MAGVRISDLPAIPSSALGDLIPEVQPAVGGTTYKATLSQLAALFNANLTFVPLAGGTITGPIISYTNSPSTALELASKGYVDSVATGLNIQASCRVGTTAALTATYANGAAGVGATLTNAGTQVAIAIDGVTLALADRVLVKNQASSFQNGIYTATTLGTGATNWVLTRAADYNQAAEIQPGDLVIITAGTLNINSSWLQTNDVVTIGTDPISFSQFSASLPISLANGGTGASLTASNGGIFYSTASAGAILSGTATARQMLQSGASTTPAWSTATYPATTTINQLLFSSATNTVTGLATGNLGVLVTDVTGTPSISATLPPDVQANITVVGTVTDGHWASFPVDELYGGTGLSDYTTGDMLYAVNTNQLAQLPGTALPTRQFLSQKGIAGVIQPPSWQSILTSDIGSGAALTRTSDTNVVLTLGGSPTVALLAATSITASWTGELSVTRGGTGLASITAHYLPIGNGTTALTLVAPNAVPGVPFISQGVSADPIYGTALVPGGGTGKTTMTAYGLLTGGTTSTGILQNVATGTAGQLLTSGGASALPTWTTATFPSSVGASGTMLRSNGTNWVASTSTYPDTYAINRVLYAQGANQIGGVAPVVTAVLATDAGGVPFMSQIIPFEVQLNITRVGTILNGTWLGNPPAAIYGGTGMNTYTAGDIIYSPSTNTLGRISTANNAVLTTNGSGVPAYTTLANLGINASLIKTVKVQVFSASGTYTPATGMLFAQAEMVGGGGGGGGCVISAGGTGGAGGGGGGGGYARELYVAATIGASQTVTIGAAGTGGANTGGDGGNGGTTSLGSLATATGGSGGGGAGSAAANRASFGGSPGVGTVSNINVTGGYGDQGIILGGLVASVGNGGGSFWGGQTPGQFGNGAGITGQNYGAGGSGGQTTGGSAAVVGGPGAPGYMLITEYCNQ